MPWDGWSKAGSSAGAPWLWLYAWSGDVYLARMFLLRVDDEAADEEDDEGFMVPLCVTVEDNYVYRV